MNLYFKIVPFVIMSFVLYTKPVERVEKLVVSEDGYPSIFVKIENGHHKLIKHRFLIDTGSFVTIIDKQILDAVAAKKSNNGSILKDINGVNVYYASMSLNKIVVLGVEKTNFNVIVADLKNSIGKQFDELVDGIIGMDILRNREFCLRYNSKTVTNCMDDNSRKFEIPVSYGQDGRPYFAVVFCEKRVDCLIDTGGMGGVDLPMSIRPETFGQKVFLSGFHSNTVGSIVRVDGLNVQVGPAFWRGIPIDFRAGEEKGSIGVDVWSAAPVCFDFRKDRVSLQFDPEQGLPISRPGRLSLPILWDRTGPIPILKVALVKPGSAMERAGCQVGDQLIQVGDLVGERLNRRNVMALVATGAPHRWVVLRGGARVNLEFR